MIAVETAPAVQGLNAAELAEQVRQHMAAAQAAAAASCPIRRSRTGQPGH